jgi:hypothetical protein
MYTNFPVCLRGSITEMYMQKLQEMLLEPSSFSGKSGTSPSCML